MCGCQPVFSFGKNGCRFVECVMNVVLTRVSLVSYIHIAYWKAIDLFADDQCCTK